MTGSSVLVAVGSEAAFGVRVSDQIGDTAKIRSESSPAHFDIVQGTVAREQEAFELSLDVAVPVPDEPMLIPGINQLQWVWFLDTDPTRFPTGYPRGTRPTDFA